MRSPRRWSLRSRLLAGVLVLVTAGFAAANVASLVLLRSYLSDRIDEQLYVAAESLHQADLSELEDDFGELPKARALLEEYVVEFRDADGALLRRLAGMGRQPVLPPLDLESVRGYGGKAFYAKADGGHHPGFRVLIVERADGLGSVVLAYDLGGYARTMGWLVTLQILITLAVLGGAIVLGIAMVRVGLRPLTEVEQTAEQIIAGGDLSRRVPERAAPGTEIGRLSHTLNTMLGEIENSFAERGESEARLRRFVADASHELRTPLAGIRGLAELHRQGAVTDPAEVAALLARIETEATRMSLLVEDLVLLARLDEQRPLRSEPVDLVPIAVDALDTARLHDPQRPMRLELTTDSPPIVVGDEDRLRQVVTNLISNALTHTPAGTPVTVRVGDCPDLPDTVLLEVADQGPGLAAEHAPRVFERFYRVDPARSRDHERSPSAGSGLGLSIVAALVAAHRGSVRYAPTPGGGATFQVRFPSA